MNLRVITITDTLRDVSFAHSRIERIRKIKFSAKVLQIIRMNVRSDEMDRRSFSSSTSNNERGFTSGRL